LGGATAEICLPRQLRHGALLGLALLLSCGNPCTLPPPRQSRATCTSQASLPVRGGSAVPAIEAREVEPLLRKLYPSVQDDYYHLFIYGPRQQAYLIRDARPLEKFPISTGKNGFGLQQGSGRTPTGLFGIAAIIGRGLPEGVVFRARLPQQVKHHYSLARIYRTPPSSVPKGLITSRILWLDGLEQDNARTKGRYIYCHGSNEEWLLGRPASKGCVHFPNQTLIDLVDGGFITRKSRVYILGPATRGVRHHK